MLEENKIVFSINVFYFSVCLTSYKLYWIEDQLANVSTRFYTSASWRWRVEPSATWPLFEKIKQTSKPKNKKHEWLELSACMFLKQRTVCQGKKIWCWFQSYVVLQSVTMLKCVFTISVLVQSCHMAPNPVHWQPEAVLRLRQFCHINHLLNNIFWKLILHHGVIFWK